MSGVANELSDELKVFDKFFAMESMQSFCRVCLSTDKKRPLLPLEDRRLAYMFTTLTSIDMSQDSFPSQVCASCKREIEHCHEFRVKCIKADNIIKSFQREEFEVKDKASIQESNTSQNISGILSKSEIKEEVDDEITDIQYLEEDLMVMSDEEHMNVKDTKMENKNYLEITIEPEMKDKTNSKNAGVTSNQKNQGHYFYCSACNKKFKKKKTLRNHMKKHEREADANACGQCKEIFTSAHDLQLHSAVHLKGPVWQCGSCHKEFHNCTVFRRHVRRHMLGKRHCCERCGKGFVEKHALRRHLRVHSGQPPLRKHACHLCDKRFTDGSLLAAHVARHTGVLPCACAECGKRFPSARLLASHALVHSDNKPHACHVCDKRFRHESTLRTHVRTHTGEKPYVCSVCGKTFIQNSNLTLHMRTHTGERPYSCSVCSRRFTSGSSLKAHARTHTGEKPYSCELCGKRFARLDVRAHLRLHAGARPHACSACPKAFVSAARLRDHTRIHTGEKPYECAMCPQKYPTKSHLVKHLKTHETKQKKPKKVHVLQHVDAVNKIYIEDVTSELDAREQDIGEEVPLEVTGELVLQENGEIKTELLVVDERNTNVCLSDVVGEYSEAPERGVKLYQLDQSLLQIHSAGGQVTISQITSKMTANF